MLVIFLNFDLIFLTCSGIISGIMINVKERNPPTVQRMATDMRLRTVQLCVEPCTDTLRQTPMAINAAAAPTKEVSSKI